MARRVKVLFLLVMVFTIGILVYTSHLRQERDADTRTLQDFYHKTKDALDRGRGKPIVDSLTGKPKGQIPVDKDADGDIDEDDAKLAKEMADRLKAAEQQAKDRANAKAPNRPDAPSDVIGVGSSAGGQVKNVGASDSQKDKVETGEDHAVEEELDRILKKSPGKGTGVVRVLRRTFAPLANAAAVIIFSKTYCPYSKTAKGLLLEKYVIDPAPYVVELDTHPLGPQIQTRLAEITGRRTVPNIMINGKSIGGSEELAGLDKEKTLVDRIKSLGGKWVEVKERFTEAKA